MSTDSAPLAIIIIIVKHCSNVTVASDFCLETHTDANDVVSQ